MLLDQHWERLVFLHWRVDSTLVAPYLPSGCRPDEYDGSSWVGLIGFEMVGAGLGYGRPVPKLGTFPEINVRLYSIDSEGRRGVVFRSLDAARLAVVLATNVAGVNYRWSDMSIEDDGSRIEYLSRRLAPPHRGARTAFAVRRGTTDMSDDPLAVFLTARWGMHTGLPGPLPTIFAPNVHRRWPLVDATLERCDDELLAAAGFPTVADRPPESVLYSDGVRTQFGRPIPVRHD